MDFGVSTVLTEPLGSMLRLDNCGGGGMRAPGSAASGSNSNALNPALHCEFALSGVLTVAAGQLLQTDAVSSGPQYHNGKTVGVPSRVVVV